MTTKNIKMQLTAAHVVYGISIANALRLAWAYAEADAGGKVISLPGAFGTLLGAGVSLGTAFIAGKLGGKLTKVRTTLVWCVLVLLLVLEPTILAPITISHMSVTMETVLNPLMRWVWAVVLALVPSLVIAGIAVANGGLIEATAAKSQSEPSESLSGAEPQPAKRSSRSKSQSEQKAKIACRYAPQCDRTFDSQNAENAHAGRCGFKPTISMPEMGAIQEAKKEGNN
jgi:hypothetical protein